MATKLEGMESELSTLEKDVRRFEERQEKQDKVSRLAYLHYAPLRLGRPLFRLLSPT